MSATTNEIVIGTQVTTPYGAGIVQWVDARLLFTVKIYHEDGVRVLNRDHVDFWPVRTAAKDGAQ